MDTAPSPRDAPQVEPLSPQTRLLSWRETRDADRFKEWCLENYGGIVQIGDYEFHPAAVLALKEGALEKARAEYEEQVKKDDDEAACSEFPSPIAVPYQQFLSGPREPTTRLLRMRDTWESVIHLLWSLVIAEGVQLGVEGEGIKIVEGDSLRNLRARDLRSDSLATGIAVIDGILNYWHVSGIHTAVGDLIPVGVCDELRRLNSVRNGFSHLGTPSDAQANRIIGESAPLLHNSLVDLLALREVQLLRLRRITPGSPLSIEVELLVGHARSRSIVDLPLTGTAPEPALMSGPAGNFDRVIAKVGLHLLDLSPYFYCCDDESGHHTSVLFFKKRQNNMCHFEVVGESHTLESPNKIHQIDFQARERALTNMGSIGGLDD